MCGISAIYNTQGHPVEARQIEKMVNSLHHRGPDDHGIFTSNEIALGSTRLSILDLSPAGHMPMEDPCTGNQIVHNGEIYNHQELAAELSLRLIKSRTDTEVILAAYDKYGEDCVKYFNGIFAFVIWDARAKKLFCARDRVGVKPLIYTYFNDKVYLASEAKALFAAGVPKAMNKTVAHEYLTQGTYDHSTATFFDGIEQLAPAHTMTISAKGIEKKRYWDLSEAEPSQGSFPISNTRDDDEIAELFGDLVTDAIKLQLRTDTPLAVHVSGGLDSMLLMTIINQLNNGQGTLKALSQIYGDDRYDEKPHVDVFSKELRWDVEYHQLDYSEVPEITEEAIWQQEQPFPGMVTLAKQILMKKSLGHGAKVVLEGQGGDEIAGGYQYYFGPFIYDLLDSGQTDLAEDELKGFSKRNNMNEAAVKALIEKGIQSYECPGRSADGTLSVSPDCLDDDFSKQDARNNSFAKPFSSKLLNMQYRDIFHTKLPRILRSCDRASMGNSRELRVPLLDHRLVEFSFHMPASAKIKNGEQRVFMRNALRKRLTPALADVPKRPVVDPQKNWLKGPLKYWVDEIINSRSFAERGLFDVKKVLQAYNKFVNDPSAPNSFPVWQWVSMELWSRRFLDS